MNDFFVHCKNKESTYIRRNLRAREGHFRVVPLAVPYAVWELLTNHCSLNF